SLEGPESEVLLHRADLLDGDVLLVVALLKIHEACDGEDIGMRPVIDLAAGKARAAATRDDRGSGTIERLREAQRDGVLTDRSRAAELVRVGNVAMDRLLPEPLEEATLPDDISHQVISMLTE